ncbi:PARP-domain-containing protein [Panus rudis PR-1116 ss-1]|nr:PARP-domain-containing protein [Panus rudis PR-1116 ss-1]
MPPRKKAAAAAGADADGAAPAATRSSTRTRAPSAKAAAVAAAANPSQDTSKPAPKAKVPTTKGAKGKKRSRDEDEDEVGEDKDQGEEEGKDEAKKPKSKRSKTAAAKDDKKAKDAKDKEDDEMEDEPSQKIVNIIKRGAAPVDPCSGKVDTHQVYVNSECVWDAMLNQTDVGKNANKFYVIQLLHPIGNDSTCVLFTRWGRVGENGQQQTKGPFPASVAVNEFKKQFKAKTGANWEDRKTMAPKKGKYMYLERDYAEEEEEKEKPKSKKAGSSKEVEKIPESKLPKETQALCNLIFSTKLIDATLSSMNYDANKLPLGKLAKSTILNGFAALKTLSEVINNPDGDTAKAHGGYRRAVEDLTGRYYSIIPHVFGRNRPTIIDDITLLKKELDLVDALGDMEVASKLIASSVLTDESGNPLNPMDAHFRSLHLSRMDPIDRSSKEFRGLEQYARDTHGHTHHFRAEVLNAFRVERQEETERWTAAGFQDLPDGDRLLLWHGSRATNFAGILKQGLRIAPPEAPVTGYMFGKGVYFADMMSKSAGYTHSYMSDNTGILLLCEVAAKPFYEQTAANYDADRACKAAGARSTKGLGRTQPAAWQDAGETLENEDLKGVHMPKGPGKDVDDNRLYLQYNEYIVYDPSQIRVRYLLMVKTQ